MATHWRQENHSPGAISQALETLDEPNAGRIICEYLLVSRKEQRTMVLLLSTEALRDQQSPGCSSALSPAVSGLAQEMLA